LLKFKIAYKYRQSKSNPPKTLLHLTDYNSLKLKVFYFSPESKPIGILFARNFISLVYVNLPCLTQVKENSFFSGRGCHLMIEEMESKYLLEEEYGDFF